MHLTQCKDIIKPISSLLGTHKGIECELSHHFVEGKYIRNMYIPGGTFAIGAIHNEDHLTVLCKGSIQLRIGDESIKVSAPAILDTLGGYRKIVFAYEDSVISNVIETELTDIQEIESRYTTIHQDKIMLNGIKELKCQ